MVLLIHYSVVCLTPSFQSITVPLILFFECVAVFKFFFLYNPFDFKISPCSKDVEIPFYSLTKSDVFEYLIFKAAAAKALNVIRYCSLCPQHLPPFGRTWHSRQNSALAVQKLMSSPGSDLRFLRVIGKVTSLLWVSLSVIWIHACSRPQQQSSVKATSGADGNQQEYMMPLGPPLGKANNLRSWSLASPLCFSSLELIKVLERWVLSETRRLEPDNFWCLLAPKFGDYHGRDWVKRCAGISLTLLLLCLGVPSRRGKNLVIWPCGSCFLISEMGITISPLPSAQGSCEEQNAVNVVLVALLSRNKPHSGSMWENLLLPWPSHTGHQNLNCICQVASTQSGQQYLKTTERLNWKTSM